jgi:hypothetical protein
MEATFRALASYGPPWVAEGLARMPAATRDNPASVRARNGQILPAGSPELKFMRIGHTAPSRHRPIFAVHSWALASETFL